MSIQGWIVQIDPGFPGNDVLGQTSDQGDRTNLCTAPRNPPFWTNQSIQLTNTSFGSPSTSAKVGDNATINVTMYGGAGGSVTNLIKTIQAWVCYPNTIPGDPNHFNLNSIVPSMNPSSPGSSAPPSWSGEAYITASLQPDVPEDYVGPPVAQGSLGALPGLTPNWTPGEADIAPGNTQAHACIVVTSSGVANADDDSQNVGFFAPGNDPTGVNVCGDGHAGQLNISIVGTSGKRSGHGRVIGFGFLSGTAVAGRANLSVSVKPVIQGAQIDPSVLKFLQAGPYKNLPLKASGTAPVSFGLMKNSHALKHGWLCRFFNEIEDELKDVIQDIEKWLTGASLPPHKHPQQSISVTAPSSGIYPLLFQAQFDPSEPEGNVHVFDIVQTDSVTGKQGGIRVAVVIAP